MKKILKLPFALTIPIRIKYGIFGMILFYILLLVSSFLISSSIVDESFFVRIGGAMHEAQCNQQYSKKRANPLNVWDFYSNLDYWLASYRLPASFTNDRECMQLLMNNMIGYKKPVSVVFIGEESKVILKIRSTF